MDLHRICPEAIPGIRILPVLHDRVDFGALVSRILPLIDPAVIAVELPTTLADAVLTAVNRLPQMSAVIAEEPGEEAIVWVSAVGDPMVESLRWAAENHRRTVFIDPDIRYRGRHHEVFPDPQVMHHLGPEEYLELVRRLAGELPCGEGDELRERGMAFHLQQAAETADGPVLAVVGAVHADRVASLLTGPTAPPLARQHRSSVLIRNLHPEDLTGVLHDPPLAHAVHEHLRRDDPPPEPAFSDTLSRRLELRRDGLRVVGGEPIVEEAERTAAVAAWSAHHARRDPGDGGAVVDRAAIGREVWRIAAASWEAQTKNTCPGWQRSLFDDYSHRHARIQGLLVSGLYEWVVAARGVGDDNLAWETFSTARCFPWQDSQSEIETARIDGEMLDLGTRSVRFRRRFFKVKRRLVPVRARRSPEDPSEWLEAFDAVGICSYPPEDLVVEDYGGYLKQKAVAILSAENSRSEPFTTSMLDGLDLRETLLRWHEGRVWVTEMGRAPGHAGSVVVIFDEDPDQSSYPYLLSWLGEHDQESDMALFATDPTQQIVGPGIMRATYGGFMLSYPPGRLYDVWRDPDYRSARSKAEVLIMAAVDYSREKLVVHLAPSPPSEPMKAYANRQAKRIVHIPIGSVSPITLRKIRVVHVLAGHDKRAIAKEYVW